MRQSGGEAGEQEATTPKQPVASEVTKPGQNNAQSDRLYPDLPHQPQFVPPFDGLGPQRFPPISHHHGQTPFVPFGIQIPASRLNADQQPAPFGRILPQPRPSTPAERLQSQSFTNGLGRRLLSIVGIDVGANSTDPQQQQQSQNGVLDDTMRALRNSTILQQLNKGLNSVYGGLSRMYNSTVQEQVNLLQERLRAETQNSTNPWRQRMAEQVPQFFKSLALKVGQAQEQLNRVWHDVSQAAQGNKTVLSRASNDAARQQAMRGPFMGSFDQFFNNGPSQGEFFNNIGRSLGFGGPAVNPSGPQGASREQTDLTSQLREFWQLQVQPQIGMMRGQIARVWRDLTASGAFSPETIIRSRSSYNQGGAQNASSSNLSLIDDILKEVDMSGSEYTLLDPKMETREQQPSAATTDQGSQSESTITRLSPQMQDRLMAMQRELNQLWMGLTSSLQRAINNVRRSINPTTAQPMGDFGAIPYQPNVMVPNNGEQAKSTDPALNEIDGRVKDLSRLQQEADVLYETVQRQQQETQRQNFGDRVRNFLNVDLSGMNQLPDRIGQQFNRFGTVVGDLWNQIPERWDNLMQNMRPPQQQGEIRARMQSASSTSTAVTPNPER